MIDLSQLAVASPVSYLIAFLVPALDAIIPVLPSETIVIALGVATVGSADPRIAVLVVLAACGAFAGDNLAYLIGRRFGPAARRRLFGSERGERRLAWAARVLDRFGIWIIIACRFIPGGRTAVTLSCGMIGYRRRSFVAATACAGGMWAAYAFFIGRLGGRAFADKPWAGLLLALGVALVLSVQVQVLRWTRPWRVLGWFRRRGSAGSPRPGSRRRCRRVGPGAPRRPRQAAHHADPGHPAAYSREVNAVRLTRPGHQRRPARQTQARHRRPGSTASPG